MKEEQVKNTKKEKKDEPFFFWVAIFVGFDGNSKPQAGVISKRVTILFSFVHRLQFILLTLL